MINVYVQLGMEAVKCAVFREWTDRERHTCQTLSNRFKGEVRALRFTDKKVLGVFVPHRVECSEGC